LSGKPKLSQIPSSRHISRRAWRFPPAAARARLLRHYFSTRSDANRANCATAPRQPSRFVGPSPPRKYQGNRFVCWLQRLGIRRPSPGLSLLASDLVICRLPMANADSTPLCTPHHPPQSQTNRVDPGSEKLRGRPSQALHECPAGPTNQPKTRSQAAMRHSRWNRACPTQRYPSDQRFDSRPLLVPPEADLAPGNPPKVDPEVSSFSTRETAPKRLYEPPLSHRSGIHRACRYCARSRPPLPLAHP